MRVCVRVQLYVFALRLLFDYETCGVTRFTHTHTHTFSGIAAKLPNWLTIPRHVQNLSVTFKIIKYFARRKYAFREFVFNWSISLLISLYEMPMGWHKNSNHFCNWLFFYLLYTFFLRMYLNIILCIFLFLIMQQHLIHNILLLCEFEESFWAAFIEKRRQYCIHPSKYYLHISYVILLC